MLFASEVNRQLERARTEQNKTESTSVMWVRDPVVAVAVAVATACASGQGLNLQEAQDVGTERIREITPRVESERRRSTIDRPVSYVAGRVG
jgi:hypothetical protein